MLVTPEIDEYVYIMKNEYKSGLGFKTLEYYPSFDNQREFEFFYEQILWNLKPIRHAVLVKVFLDANVNINNKEIPNWIEICRSKPARPKTKSDYFFIWRQDDYWKSPGYIKMRGLKVDEFSGVNVFEIYCEFLNNMLDVDILTSEKRLITLSGSMSKQINSVNIIGSGGGVSDLINFPDSDNLKDKINVFLGSAIIYKDLIEKAPPSYVIATDGASQFGRSGCALRFKEISLSLIRKANTKIVTLSHFQPIISAHWPDDVQDNFIYVPVKISPQEQFSRSTTLLDVFEAYRTRNVLTCLALPFAASLCKNISFYGVTLFPEVLNEAKHWDHYRETFYRAHVADILHFHPSALPKKQNYVDNHHQILGEIMSNFQKSGCHFFSSGSEVRLDGKKALPNIWTFKQKVARKWRAVALMIVKNTRDFINNRHIRPVWSVVNIQLLCFTFILILFFTALTHK